MRFTRSEACFRLQAHYNSVCLFHMCIHIQQSRDGTFIVTGVRNDREYSRYRLLYIAAYGMSFSRYVFNYVDTILVIPR